MQNGALPFGHHLVQVDFRMKAIDPLQIGTIKPNEPLPLCSPHQDIVLSLDLENEFGTIRRAIQSDVSREPMMLLRPAPKQIGRDFLPLAPILRQHRRFAGLGDTIMQAHRIVGRPFHMLFQLCEIALQFFLLFGHIHGSPRLVQCLCPIAGLA